MSLVETTMFGTIEPIRPNFYDLPPTLDLAHKSFRYYSELIRKYYPHSIPKRWTRLMDSIMSKYGSSSHNKVDFVEYNKDVLKLQSSLNDSHGFTNKIWDYKYEGGFDLDIIDHQVVVTHSTNPLLPVGAIILKKGKLDVFDFLKKKKKYCRGSNDFLKTFDALRFIIMSARRNAFYLISYKNQIQRVRVVYEYYLRQPKHDFVEPSLGGVIINPGAQYTREDVDAFFQRPGNKEITIDLRQYPTEFFHFMYFMERLNTSGKKLHFCNYYTAMEDGRHIKNPLYLESSKSKHNIREIKILVDHHSISASEHFVLALQSLTSIGYKVSTIGSQTRGANGDVTTIPMLYDINCNVNFNYVTYPDDTPLQRVGVRLTPSSP